MASTEKAPELSVVDIRKIVVGDRLRSADPLKLGALADSISTEGLLQPIVVNKVGETLKLVVGLHRLQAFGLLSKKDKKYLSIPCRIISVSEPKAAIMEIDENLIRNELTELQRSVQLFKKKQIYETLFPSSKVGGKRKRCVAAFTEELSRASKESRRSIERYVQIGRALGKYEEPLSKIPASSSKMELLALAGIRDDKLIGECVRLLTEGGVKTVAEARKVLDLRRMESVNGYPSLPDYRNSPLATVQMNFPLLPSQKALVEKAISKARRAMRREVSPVKDTHGNALAKICALYLSL